MSSFKQGIFIFLICIGLFSIIFYWSSEKPIEEAEYFEPPSKHREGLHYFSIPVPAKSRLILYEGLPHPVWRQKDLKSERESSATIHMDGFDFYATPIEMKPEDEMEIKGWMMNDPFLHLDEPVHKLCGGFHPDFALEWKHETGSSSTLFICLGCEEFHFTGLAPYSSGDLDERQTDLVRRVLNKYHVNWKGK